MHTVTAYRPMSVSLPDGSRISRNDLPRPNEKRWTASKKAIVARAVHYSLIDASEAIQWYDLSMSELMSWIARDSDHGIEALKSTRIQYFRKNSS